jgi:putative FmdB family regulatory protein
MAHYDYECPECLLVAEVTHGMNESPEIKCEKCGTVMKKIITGGAGFIMKSDSTRRRNDKARYGNKRKSSQPTPGESALAKAEQKRQEKAGAINPSDPYSSFRD